VEVAWYDTWPGDAQQNEYRGAWGVYGLLSSGKVLVADMQTGLYVLKPVGLTAGIQENNAVGFTMYPNPASEVVQLDEVYSTIRIIDVHGKIIHSVQNEQTISVENLADGMYMIGVEKEGNWSFKKLMKD
jgi:hypothetical protein